MYTRFWVKICVHTYVILHFLLVIYGAQYISFLITFR